VIPSAALAGTYAPTTTTQANQATSPLTGPACAPVGPGTNYPNTEVEPYLVVNPANTNIVVGTWQQDRYSDGAAKGSSVAVSSNGGQTFREIVVPGLTKCSGGTIFERASDTWLSYSKDGSILHAMTLGLNLRVLILVAAYVGTVFLGLPIFLFAILVSGLAVGTLSDRIDRLVLRMNQERAQAAEQAELLAEMTESMDEGLVVLDPAGRVERSNAASLRLARRVSPGVPDAAALADLVEMLLHPDAHNAGAISLSHNAADIAAFPELEPGSMPRGIRFGYTFHCNPINKFKKLFIYFLMKKRFFLLKKRQSNC